MVAAPGDKPLDLSVEDLAEIGQSSGGAPGPHERTGVWPHVEERLLGLIREHRSTIVFANSRRLAERLCARLNELAGEEVAKALQLGYEYDPQPPFDSGSPEKAAFVRALGADEAILYKEQDFVAAVNQWTDGQGADLVLDCVGGETFRKSIEAVAHYGDLVTLLDPGSDPAWKEARNRNLRIGFVLMLTPMLRDLPAARAHHGEILRACGEMIDKGLLRIQVTQSFPLAQAAEAHRLIEQGHVQGKLVLVV